MLNKKQVFGLALMIVLCSPACVNAMDVDGAGSGAGRGRATGAGSATGVRRGAATSSSTRDADLGHDHDDDGSDDHGAGAGAGNGGAGNGAGAGAGAGAGNDGVMNKIDGYVDMLNAPLKMAMTKITAFGAKSKLVITLLLAYLGYSASGKVAEDVQNIPNTVKSIIGADCEDSGCRGDKGWAEAA